MTSKMVEQQFSTEGDPLRVHRLLINVSIKVPVWDFSVEFHSVKHQSYILGIKESFGEILKAFSESLC